MKHFVKLFALVFVLGLLIAPAVGAQEVEPGEGGIIITANFGGDPNNINSLLVNSTVESLIADLIFPNIIPSNPQNRLVWQRAGSSRMMV